jgi:hypothetical protein
MKFKLLFILIWIVSNAAYSQQNNNLRGVRHYFSSPTLSFVGFKPLYIEEKKMTFIIYQDLQDVWPQQS